MGSVLWWWSERGVSWGGVGEPAWCPGGGTVEGTGCAVGEGGAPARHTQYLINVHTLYTTSGIQDNVGGV